MRAWSYETARDLDRPLLDRLSCFPREPDMLIYGIRLGAAAGVRLWLRFYNRLRIHGRENLPVDRSFVLVANHSSHLDAPCLLTALRARDLHRAFPAAARDYFFGSTTRLLLSAVIANALPFERHVDPRRSLTMCRNMLDTGSILVVFPEGTRSTTGEMGEFKPGIGQILAGTDHTVVPCYLEGAHRAWPKAALLPRPRQVRLIIGKPRTYSSLHPGKESAQLIARDLHDAVQALSPEIRVQRHTLQEEPT